MIPTNQSTVSGLIWTNESGPRHHRLNDRAGRDDLIIQFFKDRLCQQSSLRGNETRPDLQTGGKSVQFHPTQPQGVVNFLLNVFYFNTELSLLPLLCLIHEKSEMTSDMT